MYLTSFGISYENEYFYPTLHLINIKGLPNYHQLRQFYVLVLHGLVVTRRNYPLSFNEFENIISRKADLFAPILHGACNFANLGFTKVEDDTLSCHFF